MDYSKLTKIVDGKIVDDVDLESLSSIKEKAEAIVNAYEFPDEGIFMSGDAVDYIESDSDLMSDPKLARLVERYRSLERRAYKNGDDYMVSDFFDEKILPLLKQIANN